MATRTDQTPWRLGPRGQRWLDRLLVGGLLLLAVGHLLSDQVLSSVFTVLEALPLLWRRRHAWGAFLAVALASAGQAVVVAVVHLVVGYAVLGVLVSRKTD